MIERFYRWLAPRLPRRLLYWATIEAGVVATTGTYSDTAVPSLTLLEALERL